MTLDLQSCREDCIPGIVLFVFTCKLIVLPLTLSTLFDRY